MESLFFCIFKIIMLTKQYYIIYSIDKEIIL